MKLLSKQLASLAVSGAPGSFSEEAGRLFSMRVGAEPHMVFAIDMEGVLAAIDAGEVTHGIFPVVNSTGGLVRSAFDAMGKYTFEVIDELWFEVYHCLITMPGIAKGDITQIVSHPQALAQCERYLKQTFPQAILTVWEDTAKAAADLASGAFDSAHTAVIAPSRSAILYDLEVIEKGIQDRHPNLTTFIIVTK